jgi:methylamine dehydrogenase accessory protein MauD
VEAALLVARLVLAGVFGVAGVAKLLDAAGSRRAMLDFGVQAATAGLLGRLLTLAELAVAVALLPVATAWWAGLGALGLLVAFLAGIGLSLARGNRPDCRCFGQLYSRPIGSETLVRNAVLAALAAGIVVAGPANPGATAFGWLGELSAFEGVGVAFDVLALGLLGGMAWLMLQMLRQQGRLLLRLDTVEARLDGRFVGSGGNGPLLQIETDGHAGHHHRDGHDHGGQPAEQGLPIGAPAPDVGLPDLDGGSWALERLTEAGKPTMLIFVDPNCGACNGLLPDIGRWQREHADALRVALVSRGEAAENRRKVAEHEVGPVLLQQDFEAADAFQVPGTPSGVLVKPDGTIGSLLAVGADAIRALAARAIEGRPGAAEHADPDAAPEYGAALDALAPAFELPDLDGIKVSSDELRGQRTLLLFWNPGCGFCQRMLPDLKAWEANPPPRAPRLVLISAGSPEDNRELGLRAPILNDALGAVAREYGANGTPMAILVDAEGRIASRMAGGAPGCLALAGHRASAQPV